MVYRIPVLFGNSGKLLGVCNMEQIEVCRIFDLFLLFFGFSSVQDIRVNRYLKKHQIQAATADIPVVMWR